MTEWVFVGAVLEGQPIEIGGANLWTYEWRRIDDEPLRLPDPHYTSQYQRLWVYEAEVDGVNVRFAAGEFSNGVWGFYRPTET